MTKNHAVLVLALVLALATSGLAAPSRQDGPTPEQRVAALKQSLHDSQARLRKYEWIETTIISLKGEETARTQQRCYYGADGKVQKVPIGEAPPSQQATRGSPWTSTPRRTLWQG